MKRCLLVLSLLWLGSYQCLADKPTKESAEQTIKQSAPKWISLKDHWQKCEFGGEGDVEIKDGVIKLSYGDPLTGVIWPGPLEGRKRDAVESSEAKAKRAKIEPLPSDNYELRWECRRDQGFDFLCAFTFPVGKEQVASFVMGGWGGGITGISSIDGQDASENDTTMFKSFENETWYKARVRVEQKKITVWIDDVELFDVPREDHEFGIRWEMDPCAPLGIANFESTSQFRNIQIRRLSGSNLKVNQKQKIGVEAVGDNVSAIEQPALVTEPSVDKVDK